MSAQGAAPATWPPTRDTLDGILHDWYDWQEPKWADPESPCTPQTLYKLIGNVPAEEKDAYAARSLKYQPLIEHILAKKLRSSDIADQAVDGRSALALTILLDQHPRTIWRTDENKHIVFTQTDPLALGLYKELVRPKKLYADKVVGGEFNALSMPFFTLPLMHHEDLKDQQAAVQVYKDMLKSVPDGRRALIESGVPFAEKHRDLIEQFGRFPHRNDALKREWTKEELKWKEHGGTGF